MRPATGWPRRAQGPNALSGPRRRRRPHRVRPGSADGSPSGPSLIQVLQGRQLLGKPGRDHIRSERLARRPPDQAGFRPGRSARGCPRRCPRCATPEPRPPAHIARAQIGRPPVDDLQIRVIAASRHRPTDRRVHQPVSDIGGVQRRLNTAAQQRRDRHHDIAADRKLGDTADLRVGPDPRSDQVQLLDDTLGARRRHPVAGAVAAIAYGLATCGWYRLAAFAGGNTPSTRPRPGRAGADPESACRGGGGRGVRAPASPPASVASGSPGSSSPGPPGDSCTTSPAQHWFANSNLMTFADGAAPLADAANYATCGALAQLVIRLVPDPRQLPLGVSRSVSTISNPGQPRTVAKIRRPVGPAELGRPQWAPRDPGPPV